MITHNARRFGITYTAIKAVVHELKQEKEILVVGLNNPDLYLRMIETEGVYVEAVKVDNGFVFKLLSGEKTNK